MLHGWLSDMNNINKRIAVFGGAGFIGTPIVKNLIKNGWYVYVVTRHMPADNWELRYESNVEVHIVDVFDANEVETFFKTYHVENLINLAWYCGAKLHASLGNLDWVIATLNIAKLFAENGGKTFLGAGSVSEYDFSKGYLKEFETPLTNQSMYGRAKSSAYNMLAGYLPQMGVNFKWARIFNLFGRNERPVRLVPAVIRAILENRPVDVSSCTKIQDYSYVEDTAAAIVKFFESDVTGPVNICSGKPIQLKDIVQEICDMLKYPIEKVNFGAIPENFSDRFVVGDNSRLTNEVKYEYEYSIHDGLIEVIDDIKRKIR